MQSEWDNVLTRTFTPLKDGMDDYEQLVQEDCYWIPSCDKELLFTIYNAILKFVQLAKSVNFNVTGPFIDIAFYYACRKHMAGVFLADIEIELEPGTTMKALCTHVYCMILSPASWIYSQARPLKKLSDCPMKILWDLEKQEPGQQLPLSAGGEHAFLSAFRMYKLEPPLYVLTCE
jgi:hypothetical protein